MNNKLELKEETIIELPIVLAFKEVKKSSGIHAKIIGWWTESNYYHVEVAIGDKWISSNADQGGVSCLDLLPFNDKWTYVDLGKVAITPEQWTSLVEYVKSQYGKKYDWLGIVFSQTLPFRWHSDNKWFCSEIVTKILQILGVPETFDLYPSETSPADLARALDCNVEYKPIEG